MEIKQQVLQRAPVRTYFGSFQHFYHYLGWEFEPKVFYGDVANDELLTAYDGLCKTIGKIATAKDINAFGEYPFELYRSRFGSINELRRLTGYKNYVDPRIISKEVCMKEMLLIYAKHGRISYSMLEKTLPFHLRTLLRKFGTTSIKDVWKEVIDEYERGT